MRLNKLVGGGWGPGADSGNPGRVSGGAVLQFWHLVLGPKCLPHQADGQRARERGASCSVNQDLIRVNWAAAALPTVLPLRLGTIHQSTDAFRDWAHSRGGDHWPGAGQVGYNYGVWRSKGMTERVWMHAHASTGTTG